MKEKVPRFDGYGEGGDHIGARQNRCAFRFSVLACLLFGAILWYSEDRLRFENQAERLYSKALTQQTPPQARPFLRQAVRQYEMTHGTQSAKYLAALAFREESDLILSTLRDAYAVDPTDSMLSMRYGCLLLNHGDAGSARDVFSEAVTIAPRNALPMYLQAAAMGYEAVSDAKDRSAQADFDESLSAVARTNNESKTVVFPRPYWISGVTQRGPIYSELRKSIVADCCAPLMRYSKLIADKAASEIERNQPEAWDARLEALQKMGEQLTRSTDAGTLEVIAGIDIQLMAIEERLRIVQGQGGGGRDELVGKQDKLQVARRELERFENSRGQRIEAGRAKYTLPLELCWKGTALLIALYLLSYVSTKIIKVDPIHLSMPHTRLARAVMVSAFVFFVLMFLVMAILQDVPGNSIDGGQTVARIWWVFLGCYCCFSLFYPFFRLPSSRRVCRETGNDGDSEALRLLNKARRHAHLTFSRRYSGILCGLMLIAILIAVLAYRVFTSVYPWQIEFLASGFSGEEATLVRQVLAPLL